MPTNLPKQHTVSRPGIAIFRDGGHIDKVNDIEKWTSVESGDELWFFLMFGAEGTDYGGFNWKLIRNNRYCRFGYSTKDEPPTSSLMGFPFPNEHQHFNEKRGKDTQEFLWNMQVLLSALTRFKTVLDLAPPELPVLTQQMNPQRFAVIRFIEDGGEH